MIYVEPAFPNTEINDGHVINNPGMSLRDYFAAKAMPVFIDLLADPEIIAKNSYDVADAMLKARES